MLYEYDNRNIKEDSFLCFYLENKMETSFKSVPISGIIKLINDKSLFSEQNYRDLLRMFIINGAQSYMLKTNIVLKNKNFNQSFPLREVKCKNNLFSFKIKKTIQINEIKNNISYIEHEEEIFYVRIDDVKEKVKEMQEQFISDFKKQISIFIENNDGYNEEIKIIMEEFRKSIYECTSWKED